jgi:hypothetical protein
VAATSRLYLAVPVICEIKMQTVAEDLKNIGSCRFLQALLLQLLLLLLYDP